jgi:hypothetical protein
MTSASMQCDEEYYSDDIVVWCDQKDGCTDIGRNSQTLLKVFNGNVPDKKTVSQVVFLVYPPPFVSTQS